MTNTFLKLQKKLNLPAQHKTLNMLEGEYVSALKGKSIDFNDLKEYVPGDEVRDIDWRATARMNTPLVKQYVAHKRNNLLFIPDTSAGMAANTENRETKNMLAAEIMTALMSIALRQNDNLSIGLANAQQRTQILPFNNGEAAASRILTMHERASQNSVTPSTGVHTLLDHAVRMVKKPTIMVIISDLHTPDNALQSTLRAAAQRQHTLYWFTVEEINPIIMDVNTKVYDLLLHEILEADFQEDVTLLHAVTNEIEELKSEVSAFMAANRVQHSYVHSTQNVLPALLRVLHESKRGRR